MNNLLNTIKSGDIIEMDGTTGIIKIIKRNDIEGKNENVKIYTV